MVKRSQFKGPIMTLLLLGLLTSESSQVVINVNSTNSTITNINQTNKTKSTSSSLLLNLNNQTIQQERQHQSQTNQTKVESVPDGIQNQNVSQAQNVTESRPPSQSALEVEEQQTTMFIPDSPAVFLDDDDIAAQKAPVVAAQQEPVTQQEPQVPQRTSQAEKVLQNMYDKPEAKTQQVAKSISFYQGSRQKTGKRSLLQEADEVLGDGDIAKDTEQSDPISKASDSDIGAYSEALQFGGAQKVIDMLAPEPVKAEEDSGGMALFMNDVGNLADEKLGYKQSKNEENSDAPASGNEDDSGADFAAQFAIESEKNQQPDE